LKSIDYNVAMTFILNINNNNNNNNKNNSKSRFFYILPEFDDPFREFPSKYCHNVCHEKTQNDRIVTIHLDATIQYCRVTGEQMTDMTN